MKVKQVIDANRAVMELSGAVLPYKAARGVAMLKKRLMEEFRIILQQEMAIAERHGGKSKGSGLYHFQAAEELEVCKAEMDDLHAQEADIDLPMVDLSEYADSLRISPAAIEALEGIVIFEQPEKTN